jgi:hypothetical protein
VKNTDNRLPMNWFYVSRKPDKLCQNHMSDEPTYPAQGIAFLFLMPSRLGVHYSR